VNLTPDKVQARKMVLVSIFLLALLSTYRDRKDASAKGTFRVLWGVGVVGMFLSLLADFLPQIAGPFAVLIVLGSLTNGGEQIIERALGLLATPGATAAPAPVTAPHSPNNRPGPAGAAPAATG
jgi:hypothetical protein